jgi:hypothetical protein
MPMSYGTPSIYHRQSRIRVFERKGHFAQGSATILLDAPFPSASERCVLQTPVELTGGSTPISDRFSISILCSIDPEAQPQAPTAPRRQTIPFFLQTAVRRGHPAAPVVVRFSSWSWSSVHASTQRSLQKKELKENEEPSPVVNKRSPLRKLWKAATAPSAYSTTSRPAMPLKPSQIQLAKYQGQAKLN